MRLQHIYREHQPHWVVIGSARSQYMPPPTKAKDKELTLCGQIGCLPSNCGYHPLYHPGPQLPMYPVYPTCILSSGALCSFNGRNVDKFKWAGVSLIIPVLTIGIMVAFFLVWMLGIQGFQVLVHLKKQVQGDGEPSE